jgi:hypothetical protein
VYLNEPDGNGLELYYDLPREQWPTDEEGRQLFDGDLFGKLDPESAQFLLGNRNDCFNFALLLRSPSVFS